MIFRLFSVRASVNVFFLGKIRPNCFTLNKNVRFLHDVETENKLPASGYGIRKMISKEMLYFKIIFENNPKYPDLSFREEILKANENSSNKLVILLRNAVNIKTSQGNECVDFELSGLTDFEDDEYSLHDITEIFHFLKNYCELLSKAVEPKWENLCNLMIEKMKQLRKGEENIGLMITVLNLMKDLYIPQRASNNFIKYIYKKSKRLTTVQLVEYFYILQHHKMFVTKDSKFEFGLSVTNSIPKLNIDEMAALTYAFFRSMVLPGTYVTKAVATRVLEEIEHINDFQACTIFKKNDWYQDSLRIHFLSRYLPEITNGLNSSADLYNWLITENSATVYFFGIVFLQFSGCRAISANLDDIFEKCVPILDKFTIMSAIHIINSGVSVNTENKKLFEVVWNRANKEFDQLRLKDVERLLLVSLYSNFHLTEDSEFVQLIVQKFTKSNRQIIQYPISFFGLITFLIMHNIYLEDLIKYAVSDEYQKLLLQINPSYKKPFRRQVLFIEASVELERPEYKLTPMPFKERKAAAQEINYHQQQETSSRRCNAKILDALENIYNTESVTYVRPLVHYETNHPILCVNKNNEPQKIGDKLEALNSYNTIEAPNDGNLWIAFIPLRFQGCLKDKVTPNLVSEAKLRHFRIAGYIPLVVYNFLILPKTSQELEVFLDGVIKDKIQSLNN